MAAQALRRVRDEIADEDEPAQPHPFAVYTKTIGRGPTLSRPLDTAEAEAAMGMILDGRVEPVQLGAFLLVLRYRTETPEELAGFVRAARTRLVPGPRLRADLDWPSYADRHKQLPYFVLAALLLARNGVRVAMHGLAGESAATTRHGLAALGLRPARSREAAAEQLERTGFAYLPIEVIAPALARLFELRPLLGLRSPVNTLARELNPFEAPAQIQGIFHPTYLELHERTQRLLGQPRAVTFKGGGGEGQRNPEKPCRVRLVANGEAHEETWPALTPGEAYPWRSEPLEPSRLRALWQGEWQHPAVVAVVTGTAAAALVALGRAGSLEAAQRTAEAWWQARGRDLPV